MHVLESILDGRSVLGLSQVAFLPLGRILEHLTEGQRYRTSYGADINDIGRAGQLSPQRREVRLWDEFPEHEGVEMHNTVRRHLERHYVRSVASRPLALAPSIAELPSPYGTAPKFAKQGRNGPYLAAERVGLKAGVNILIRLKR